MSLSRRLGRWIVSRDRIPNLAAGAARIQYAPLGSQAVQGVDPLFAHWIWSKTRNMFIPPSEQEHVVEL